jgi:hypothetical protein
MARRSELPPAAARAFETIVAPWQRTRLAGFTSPEPTALMPRRICRFCSSRII